MATGSLFRKSGAKVHTKNEPHKNEVHYWTDLDIYLDKLPYFMDLSKDTFGRNVLISHGIVLLQNQCRTNEISASQTD
jgi:hypothetical protein